MNCQNRNCISEGYKKKATCVIRHLMRMDYGSLEFKFGVIYSVCTTCFDKSVDEANTIVDFNPFLDDRPSFICGDLNC